MKYAQIFPCIVAVALPLAAATHDSGCTVGSAEAGTYLVIDSIVDLDGDGLSETFYCEERDTGLAPIFLTGFLLGNGTWCYEENRNYFPDAESTLQRGGVGPPFGEAFPPGCDESYDLQDDEGPGLKNLAGWIGRLNAPAPGQVPCLATSEDPITDEVCGHLTFYDDMAFGAKRTSTFDIDLG